MHLRGYVRFARRWGALSLVLALIAASAAYVLTKKLSKPIYSASATMQVQLGATGPTSNIQPFNDIQFATTEAAVAAQSPNVVAALHKLATDLGPKLPPGELPLLQSSVSCHADTNTALFTCSVDSHDPVIAAAAANDLTTVFIAREQAFSQSRYRALLKRLLAQEKAAATTLTQDQAALRPLQGNPTGNASEIANLTAQLTNDQQRYNNLLQLETTVRQSASQQANIMRIVAPAQPPIGPSSPHPTLNALIAFILAFALVSVSGIITERVDDAVRGEEELKELMGVPLLGEIPLIDQPDGRPVALAPRLKGDKRHAQSTEAFRVVRTALTFVRIDNPPRTLLVTSAIQGEGKSTVASFLAASFGETGKRVILVDLDLRRPTIAQRFGVQSPGLSSLVLQRESKSVESYLVQTDMPNLWVLPSGPVPPNPAELVGTQRMREVLRDLTEVADLVVVDCPPVLAVTDAVILSTQVDAVLLVTRPDRVKRRPLKRARETLEGVGVTPVGMVVNALSGKYADYYSYYVQSYYYAQKSSGSAGKNGTDRATKNGSRSNVSLTESGSEVHVVTGGPTTESERKD